MPVPTAANFLRQRRALRAIVLFSFCILFFTTIVAQVKAIGHARDDWSEFDHRRFQVTAVPAGNILEVQTRTGPTETIKLANVEIPSENDREREIAQDYVSNQVLGKKITLLLDTPQTRDEQGQLLAYVFEDETNDLNVDIVKQGFAHATKRGDSPVALQVRSAEADASTARKVQRTTSRKAPGNN